MTTTPCKGCGRPIRWAVSPTGADLPLEEVHAYWLDPGVRGAKTQAVRSDAPVWISHFLTCTERERFSGANKRRR